MEHVEIPFNDAPQWLRDAWLGLYPHDRPHVRVYRTEKAVIGQPWHDYAVRTIIAHNKRGETEAKGVPSYDTLLCSSRSEQKLYCGGEVPLLQDEAVAVFDYMSNLKTVDLYVNPADFEPPKTIAPSLTERQKHMLAAIRGLISKAKLEEFRQNGVTEEELEQLRQMGLTNKANALTMTGKNVANSIGFNYGRSNYSTRRWKV